MEVTETIPSGYRNSRKTVLPEVESYLRLLVVIKLLDSDNIDKVPAYYIMWFNITYIGQDM